jgi:hypothetical protein
MNAQEPNKESQQPHHGGRELLERCANHPDLEFQGLALAAAPLTNLLEPTPASAPNLAPSPPDSPPDRQRLAEAPPTTNPPPALPAAPTALVTGPLTPPSSSQTDKIYLP